MTHSIPGRLALIALIAGLISDSTTTVLSGQEKNQPSPPANVGTTVTPAAAPTCPAPTDPQPRVTQISRHNRDTKTAENNAGDLIVQLRDEVIVKIENLPTL